MKSNSYTTKETKEKNWLKLLNRYKYRLATNDPILYQSIGFFDIGKTLW